MSSTRRSPRQTTARRWMRRGVVLALLLATTTACTSNEFTRLGMPDPASRQAKQILTLWQGSWIAAFAVGLVVWGLIIWAIIFHRRRTNALPPQVRYNLPIEVLYTVVPFIMVAVLFYFTARDETDITKVTNNPRDLVVNVTGFQWSWQFDYPQYGVSVVGKPAQNPSNPTGIPTLVLPVNQTVHFNLTSTDVVHAFWVPAFLFKRDAIPGQGNQFEITPTKEGTYAGRCSELCGVLHSGMLFTVKVVSPQEFQSFIATHKAAGSSQ